MLELKLFSVTVVIYDDDYYFDKWSYSEESCIEDVKAMFKSAGCSGDSLQIYVDEADPDDR